MNWNSLFSGFLGTVIGAAIASIVTFFTAKWQMKNSIKLQINWEKNRFEEKEKQQNKSLVNNIIAEVENNIEIASDPQHHYSWIYLSIGMWKDFRGKMEFLPERIQTHLRAAYIQAHNYNIMLDDRRAMGDHGRGYWDRPLNDKIQLTKQLCEKALVDLKNWLDQLE